MEAITMLQKKHYGTHNNNLGFLSKIFCCKCIHCCQVFIYSYLGFWFFTFDVREKKGSFLENGQKVY